MNQGVEETSGLSPGGAVLVIDEDPEQLEFVRGVIQAIGYSVQACNSYTEGMRQLVSGAFDVVVVGQGGRSFEGRYVLESAGEFSRRLPVVVVARQLEMECYLEAMQLGAVDYLAEPSVGVEIARVMRNLAPHRPARVAAATLTSRPISEMPVA